MTAGSVYVPQIIPLRAPCPGRNKHEINTNTFVEMKSDTPDVIIYYTLDGSKPELLKRKGFGENNTFKYTGPITLPDGKIQVKAKAVSRDCRESGIVTKIFQVDYEPPSITSFQEDSDENIHKNFEKQELKSENLASKLEERGKNRENKPACIAEIKCQDNPMETPSCKEETVFTQLTNHKPQFTNSPGMNGQKKLTSAQVLRLNKATNFFKCTNCLTTRPCDPFTRFCQECGTPVPPLFGQHHPPPEEAEMGMCSECKSIVPVNASLCIVCEASLDPRLQSQDNIHLKDKGICLSCGTGNPAPFKHCVTCESPLPETHVPIFTGEVTSPLINQKATTIFCSKCGRKNRCDARFCDWCGAKPTLPACYSICAKCRASSYPNARYCGSCGEYLEPFTNIESSNGKAMEILSESQSTWPYAPKTKSNMPEKKDKGTQTIGLFYPSNKFFVKKELDFLSQKERQEKRNDHRPQLTAISPGRGYWRKQLDHIFAHLKSYAQNNPNFRALVGEPRMGKLLSATIHEDNYSVSIRLNYMQITKGADPNCTNNEDRPSLTVAVLNKHHEAIPVLLQKGADINHQSGPLGNTALHEACLLGPEGKKCVAALLRYNASIQKKNEEGESAYDLALKMGNDEIISLFAAKLDPGIFNQHTQSKNLSLKDF